MSRLSSRGPSTSATVPVAWRRHSSSWKSRIHRSNVALRDEQVMLGRGVNVCRRPPWSRMTVTGSRKEAEWSVSGACDATIGRAISRCAGARLGTSVVGPFSVLGEKMGAATMNESTAALQLGSRFPSMMVRRFRAAGNGPPLVSDSQSVASASVEPRLHSWRRFYSAARAATEPGAGTGLFPPPR